jgi:hypothetical protein
MSTTSTTAAARRQRLAQTIAQYGFALFLVLVIVFASSLPVWMVVAIGAILLAIVIGGGLWKL